jgi:hypothetical protein
MEDPDTIHLKQLSVGEFRYEFKEFQILAKDILNLRSLRISVKNSTDAIDA